MNGHVLGGEKKSIRVVGAKKWSRRRRCKDKTERLEMAMLRNLWEVKTRPSAVRGKRLKCSCRLEPSQNSTYTVLSKGCSLHGGIEERWKN